MKGDDLTPLDKLVKARELKDEGGELFRGSEWKKAARKYHYALLYVKGAIDTKPNDPLIKMLMKQSQDVVELSPAERQEAHQLQMTLLNNLAGKLCLFYYQLHHYPSCLSPLHEIPHHGPCLFSLEPILRL